VRRPELEARDYPGAFHAWRSTRSTARPGPRRARCTSRRPPELLPRCALIAHPTTSATSTCSGHVRSLAFGVEVPVSPRAPSPTRARHRHVLTFGTDRRRWWRELRLPARSVIGRDGPGARDPGWLTAEAGAAGRRGDVGGAGRQDDLLRPRRRRGRAAAAERRPHGEPWRPSARQLLREGDKPLRSSLAPVVHQQRRSRRGAARSDARARHGAGFQPTSCACATRTGGRADGDWLVSRQRFFGVRYRSGTRSTRPARPLRRPDRAGEDSCPSTRPSTCRRASPAAAARPAGS